MSSQAKVSKKTLKKQNEVSIALNLNLRELVEDNDIKQTELAAKLNVSKSCFNKWLTTNRQPNLEHLILLADEPLELKALNNVPLCLAYSSAPRLLQLMDQEQLNVKVVCMNLHRANALIAATHGLGAAIFPLPATYEDAELISRPIASPLLKSRNVLYTLKDKELSQVSKLFLKYMLQKL